MTDYPVASAANVNVVKLADTHAPNMMTGQNTAKMADQNSGEMADQNIGDMADQNIGEMADQNAAKKSEPDAIKKVEKNTKMVAPSASAMSAETPNTAGSTDNPSSPAAATDRDGRQLDRSDSLLTGLSGSAAPPGVPLQEPSGEKTRRTYDLTQVFHVGLSCHDIQASQGATKSGIYLIHPPNLSQGPWQVYSELA